MASIGKIIGVNGNLIRVKFESAVSQNEVAYAKLTQKNKDGKSEVIPLKSEVIRIRGDYAELQVFEDTTGLKTGDEVDFTGELLSVELGPGLLTQVFDGLQNPLPKLAEECGFFLQRGKYAPARQEVGVYPGREGGRCGGRWRYPRHRARRRVHAPHHGAVPPARQVDRGIGRCRG